MVSRTKREKVKLTDARIRALKPPTDRSEYTIWDTEQKGFGVRVTKKGSKTFIVRIKIDGKPHQLKIDDCNDLPVKYFDENNKEVGARFEAEKLIRKLKDGIDPNERKKKIKASKLTFGQLKIDYVANKRTKYGPLRPSSKKDIERCLPEWDDILAAKITQLMCYEKFIEKSITGPTQANRTLKNARALFNFVMKKEFLVDGKNNVFTSNPVTPLFIKDGIASWNSAEPRETRIEKEKIGAVVHFLMEFSTNDNTSPTKRSGVDLILFLLFTGCRIGEARTLTWDKVDLSTDTPTFFLDPKITKNHNKRTLPISDPLLQILKRRKKYRIEDNNFIFPSTSGSTGYIADPRTLFKKISTIAGSNIHPHALRRTFDDIAELDGIEISSDKKRQLLNHKASDVHGKAYSNNPNPETLRSAVQKIGNWIVEQGKIAAGENVIRMNESQRKMQ